MSSRRAAPTPVHGTVYDFIRDDNFNARKRAVRARSCRWTSSSTAAASAARFVRNRTFYFANFEQRLLDQSGLVTILPENVPIINARLAAIGLSGCRRSRTGIYPNPVHSANFLGKLDHQVSGSDQFTVRYSLYHVTSDNSRGAGALNAPTASAGLDNVDHSHRLRQHVDDLADDRQRDARAVRVRRPEGAANRSDRPGRQHRRRRVVRHAVGQPDEAPEQDVPDRRQPLAPGGGARAAGRRRTSCSTTTRSRTRGRPAAATRSRRWRTFSPGNYSGFTQTFGDPVVSQTNPNVGMYAQDEWQRRVETDAEPRPSLRPAVPARRSTPTRTTSRRGSVSPGRRRRRTTSSSAAAPGCSSTAFRSAPSPTRSCPPGTRTDLDKLHQPSVSGIIPAQDGAPAFPNILPARLLTTTLVDFTTMDEHLQNAYSKQASIEVERSLGAGRTVSVGYQYIRGENLLMSVNQNVPTCVAAGTNNGCRPDATYRNNNQYSSLADSNYHGLHVSFVQRPTAWASVRVTYTLSKSMNDVGEAFFSSPIDPTDIMTGLGSIGRRPAASSRDQRDDQHARWRRPRQHGSASATDSVERHAAGPTRRCRSTSRRA